MTALPTAFSPQSAPASSKTDVRSAVRDVDIRLWDLVLLSNKQCSSSDRDTLIEAAQRISAQVRDAVASAFGPDAMATSHNRPRGGRSARTRKVG